MFRTVWLPALALGVVLAMNGPARAADNPAKSDFGATMTLAGKGTAAEAASADDTELAHYYRGYYGGYRGGYYGGYRPYYGGYRGYYGGWGGGYGYGYRPYYTNYYYRPYYYRPYYGWGYSSWGYGYGYGGYYGGYCGISASEADTSAPVMTLALKTMNNPVVPREPASTGFGGGFRYDGGPANPVALPKWEPAPTTAAASDNLPVALQKSKPTVSGFKAYGEK